MKRPRLARATQRLGLAAAIASASLTTGCPLVDSLFGCDPDCCTANFVCGFNTCTDCQGASISEIIARCCPSAPGRTDARTDPTQCQDGTSTASVSGGPSATKSGAEACAGPASVRQTTGGGATAEVSAGIEPAFSIPGQTVQSFALQCATVVTGGVLGAATSCSTTTTQSLPYAASDASGQIFASATLASLATAGGAVPAAASASVDCGSGAVSLPLNSAGFTNVPLGSAAGFCTVDASLDGGTDGSEGSFLERLTVTMTGDPGGCVAHEQCRIFAPATPFCGPAGDCQAGLSGDPCLHDSQCDRAAGWLCGSDGFCTDGDPGTSCQEDTDCDPGLSCDASTFACAP